MARNSKIPIRRRFFKVMRPGFRSKLSFSWTKCLPEGFCRQLKGKTLDKTVMKNSEGEWHIEVGKCGNGLLYLFGNGWEDFVKHYALNLGDFLVFEHQGNFIFDFIVLGSNKCEKERPVSINLANKKTDKKVSSDELANPFYSKGGNPMEEAQSYSTKNPHFVTTITSSHGAHVRSYLHIPAEFARSINLGRASIVILRDPSRKLWPVKLYNCDSIQSRRTLMKKGWSDFYVANELKEGDVCLFELDLTRNNSHAFLMDVRIFPLPN